MKTAAAEREIGSAAISSSASITEDEIAAAILAVHALRGRVGQPSNRLSGWRWAARAEAVGDAAPDWGRKSWAR